MKRWQALLALLGLFALGVAAGGLGAHLYYSRALDRPPGPPPLFPALLGPRLQHQLELTPEQARQVRAALEESRREAEVLRDELAPRMLEVVARGEGRIREILTPEQQQRLEEMRRRHRHRADRFFGGPGEPRGPRHRRPHGDD